MHPLEAKDQEAKAEKVEKVETEVRDQEAKAEKVEKVETEVRGHHRIHAKSRRHR
jgi:hypothetical protein